MCVSGRSGEEMHEGIEDTNHECTSLEKNKRLNAAEHRQCYRKIRTGLCLDPTESVHTDWENIHTEPVKSVGAVSF